MAKKENNQVEEVMIDVVTLTDPDGNDVEFELLDSFEYEGEDYVILVPLGDESGEVTILKIIENEDGEDDDYVSPKTEEELQAVFEYFMERVEADMEYEED